MPVVVPLVQGEVPVVQLLVAGLLEPVAGSSQEEQARGVVQLEPVRQLLVAGLLEPRLELWLGELRTPVVLAFGSETLLEPGPLLPVVLAFLLEPGPLLPVVLAFLLVPELVPEPQVVLLAGLLQLPLRLCVLLPILPRLNRQLH